jgi:hypothetical protein
MLKIKHLAVRPEHVEGRMANYDTVSEGGAVRLETEEREGVKGLFSTQKRAEPEDVLPIFPV